MLALQLFVEKVGLPPALVDRINRLAAFQNPQFYEKETMRLSTALTPHLPHYAFEGHRSTSVLDKGPSPSDIVQRVGCVARGLSGVRAVDGGGGHEGEAGTVSSHSDPELWMGWVSGSGTALST